MSSSPHIQNAVFDVSDIEPQYEAELDFETEPETDIETDPDKEYIIQNQLGLPDYQYGVYESSPPPVDANVNCDKLNNEKGEFLKKRKFAKADFSVSQKSLQNSSQ
jgi:hypothetical protein